MDNLLSVFLAVVVQGQVDPAHKDTLVLYHQTQPQFQSLGLKNQDTGDLGGDSYFVLRSFSLPVECASKNPMAKFDCDNPEQNDTDTNVVSMNIVDVDSRYGIYGACNVNEANGTYSCSCRGAPQSFCNASVGRSDVATREQPPYGRGENWQWWRVNLARKMRGNWYSTVASGECGSSTSSSTSKAAVNANVTVNAGVGAGVGAAAAAGCTWSLKKTVRTITSQCLLNRVGDAVVDHDSTCFQSCAQPKNISSPCFVDCFMANVLGPDGGSKLISPTDGIPLSTIEDAWNTAFAPAASGGCPNPDSAGTRQDV